MVLHDSPIKCKRPPNSFLPHPPGPTPNENSMKRDLKTRIERCSQKNPPHPEGIGIFPLIHITVFPSVPVYPIFPVPSVHSKGRRGQKSQPNPCLLSCSYPWWMIGCRGMCVACTPRYGRVKKNKCISVCVFVCVCLVCVCVCVCLCACVCCAWRIASNAGPSHPRLC